MVLKMKMDEEINNKIIEMIDFLWSEIGVKKNRISKILGINICKISNLKKQKYKNGDLFLLAKLCFVLGLNLKDVIDVNELFEEGGVERLPQNVRNLIKLSFDKN